MDADDRGCLWLELVSLFIAIRGRQVECYDSDGTRLGSYAEVYAALSEAAKARKEAEALAASERDARRDAEARAGAAEARLTAEAPARVELEARMRDLEAKLLELH